MATVDDLVRHQLDAYDASYPVSALAARGADAGIPGTFTPIGCRPPATVAALIRSSVKANPATPWTTGQYVQTAVAGASGRATWTGTAWVGGAAPDPTKNPPPPPPPPCDDDAPAATTTTKSKGA